MSSSALVSGYNSVVSPNFRKLHTRKTLSATHLGLMVIMVPRKLDFLLQLYVQDKDILLFGTA